MCPLNINFYQIVEFMNYKLSKTQDTTWQFYINPGSTVSKARKGTT